MALESVTHIGDLVVTNPVSADPKSQGDDHIRNIKTAIANDLAGFTGAVCVAGSDGGVVNAYTLTPARPLVAYGLKMLAVIAPTVTNTAAATLNVSALGDKAIKRVDGTDLVAGDLSAGALYIAVYNGTEFRLLSPTKAYIDQMAFGGSLPAQSLGFLRSTGTLAGFTQTHTGYAQKEVKAADIASAATIDLTAAAGNLVHITGAAGPVTAITVASGAEYTLVFDSTPTLVNSATLILPGGANITAAAGDSIKVRGDGAAARVVSYQRANGMAVMAMPYAKFSDQRASGTSGGNAIAADATQTRTVNTVDANTITGASLASNTITLPAGTYQYSVRAPAYQVNAHKAALYNTSDAVYVGYGTAERAGSSADVSSSSVATGQFTIAGAKNFTVRHYTQSTNANGNTLGIAASSGQPEQFTVAEFWKVA